MNLKYTCFTQNTGKIAKLRQNKMKMMQENNT